MFSKNIVIRYAYTRKHMNECYEYQIMIGCGDSQTHSEIVDRDQLKEILIGFFRKNRIDFSIIDATGGFLHSDGRFITENTMCVNIVGDPGINLIRLSKTLSTLMNQESVLIIRNKVNQEIR